VETKNREKLLMIATGALAALWLLNLLVISPLIDCWHSRSGEIAKLKKQIADGTMLVRRESTVRGRWDTMRANALASNPTAAERQLFTAFDHWVAAGGVTEGSFRPQVTEGDTNFSTVDCRSDVSGSLDNVRDFLRAMSKDPLANKVEAFEVTSRDDNGQQLTLGLSMSGLILTDSDPSALPPAAPPQETNSAPDAGPDLFQLISRNNIFDQSRTPRDNPGRRAPRVESITCSGVGLGSGPGSTFFEGTGIDESRNYKVGDSVTSEFKVAKITLDAVTLTNSSSNIFVLPVRGASLRREENEPWRLSGYIAADPPPGTNATESVSSPTASGAGGNNILEMLKKRREQEEK
jgi:hypothetical protein